MAKEQKLHNLNPISFFNEKRKESFWYKIKTKQAPLKDFTYSSLPTIVNYKSKNKKIIDVINLTQIYKKYKKENVVYTDLNISFYENENVAILGPNGSGKTTLVETICGTKKPTNGKIEFYYEYKNNPHELIGVQFQDLRFPSSLSVKDIIQFIIDLSNLKNIDIDEFNSLLDNFYLKSLLHIKASKLSGGQQQRLNVFLSLIHKPKVLILDEFTTGLDIAIKSSIQNFIKNYVKKNNITLIIISHDIEAISDLSERIIILADKKIKVDMSASDIVKEYKSVSNLLHKYIIY